VDLTKALNKMLTIFGLSIVLFFIKIDRHIVQFQNGDL
jgi:hypothetical protein